MLGSRLMEAACTAGLETGAAAGAGAGVKGGLQQGASNREGGAAATGAPDGAQGGLPQRAVATMASNGEGDTAAAPTVPYVIVSHSMGCWVAYEMLRMAREQGGQAEVMGGSGDGVQGY